MHFGPVKVVLVMTHQHHWFPVVGEVLLGTLAISLESLLSLEVAETLVIVIHAKGQSLIVIENPVYNGLLIQNWRVECALMLTLTEMLHLVSQNFRHQ